MKPNLSLTALLFLVAGIVLPSPVEAAAPQRIIVPLHDIARGEVISNYDVTAVPAAGLVQPGTVTAAKEIVGLETRRVLRAGESLRPQDFRHPVIVTKGSMVSMVFEAPGVSLNATMRATSAGGLGEIVTVQNPVSYRQVTAIVTGPGEVKAQAGGGLTLRPDQPPMPMAAIQNRLATAVSRAEP